MVIKVLRLPGLESGRTRLMYSCCCLMAIEVGCNWWLNTDICYLLLLEARISAGELYWNKRTKNGSFVFIYAHSRHQGSEGL